MKWDAFDIDGGGETYISFVGDTAVSTVLVVSAPELGFSFTTFALRLTRCGVCCRREDCADFCNVGENAFVTVDGREIRVGLAIVIFFCGEA